MKLVFWLLLLPDLVFTNFASNQHDETVLKEDESSPRWGTIPEIEIR